MNKEENDAENNAEKASLALNRLNHSQKERK